MKKVMVLQSAKAYVEKPELTKVAFLAYCDEMFGKDSCQLVPVPNEAYESGYDITTGDVIVSWTDTAVEELAKVIQDVDVVILTKEAYKVWMDDDIVSKITDMCISTTFLSYIPTTNEFKEVSNDKWM